MPRANPYTYGGLSVPEREIEDLARTVVCPNCGAQPLKRCVSRDRNADGDRKTMYSSHLGRLLVARGETP